MELYKVFWLLVLVLKFAKAQEQSPNIILILVDDGGFNDFGFHGSTEIPTPNIDALAYSGVILNNVYSLHICTPSRAALLTGMYPYRYGLATRGVSGTSTFGMPTNLTTIAGHLKVKGYSTHIVGKWHLGHATSKYAPVNRGFDSFLGFWLGYTDDYWDHWYRDKSLDWIGWDYRRNMDVEWDQSGAYLTHSIGNESTIIIESHNFSQPLFLLVSHAGVHFPLQAPLETLQMFSYIDDPDRRTYAAMLYEVDKTVGSIVETLDGKNMLENSVILVTSDNGGDAAYGASNWPLRGHKTTLWEGGVRSASLLWSPRVTNPGRVYSQLIHFTDWLPTLVSAAGGGIDLGDIDGIDAWSAIVGDTPSLRTEALVNIDLEGGSAALRRGDWKIATNPGSDSGWMGYSGRNGTAPQESWQFIKSAILNSTTAEAVLKIFPNAYEDIEKIRADAMINCTEVPRNVTSPAECSARPCLFNILEDPCEYYDKSEEEPLIYQALYDALLIYNESSFPPFQDIVYEESNPIYWNDTWNNWLDYPSSNTTAQATTFN